MGANKQLVFPPSTWGVNMRGLILLLPVLLVLFLAGNVRTEEESSLVEDAADLSSNLLPLGEKVEVREAREAGQEDRIKKRKKSRKIEKETGKDAENNRKKKKKKTNKPDKKKADKKKNKTRKTKKNKLKNNK